MSPHGRAPTRGGAGRPQGCTHSPPRPTHLLLQPVHGAGHTLVAWLVVPLGHGVLQVLLELGVELHSPRPPRLGDVEAGADGEEVWESLQAGLGPAAGCGGGGGTGLGESPGGRGQSWGQGGSSRSHGHFPPPASPRPGSLGATGGLSIPAVPSSPPRCSCRPQGLMAWCSAPKHGGLVSVRLCVSLSSYTAHLCVRVPPGSCLSRPLTCW